MTAEQRRLCELRYGKGKIGHSFENEDIIDVVKLKIHRKEKSAYVLTRATSNAGDVANDLDGVLNLTCH